MSTAPDTANAPDPADEALLRLVWYFDVFGWPLMESELATLAGDPQWRARVGTLKARGQLGGPPGWVHAPGRDRLVSERRPASERAERMWPMARRAASILARAPFVRGVLVTGGMSKRCIREDADVDFLLIVAPGRVWLAKTQLQLFRRALPGWLRKHFCTNYLIAADALAIPEQTAFTAIELATAVPMYGPEAATALLQANRWAQDYVPGFDWSIERARCAQPLPMQPRGRSDGALAPVAERLDHWAMGAWDAFWNRKYGWLSEGDRSKRFKRERGVATNHLGDHQQWLLDTWAERLDAAGVSQP